MDCLKVNYLFKMVNQVNYGTDWEAAGAGHDLPIVLFKSSMVQNPRC